MSDTYEIRQDDGSVNVIAVENGGKTNVSPVADYVICQGDTMVVLGDNIALEKVQKL